MAANRTLIAFGGLALTLLVGGVISSFIAVRSIDSMADEALATTAAIDQAEVCISHLLNAETSMRGYVITGDTKFLAPYDAIRSKIASQCSDAAATASQTENPAPNTLSALNALVSERIAVIDAVIELRRNGDIAGATLRVSNKHGKELMDQIRLQIGRYIGARQPVLLATLAQSKAVMQDFIWLMVGLSCLGLILVAAFVWLIYRDVSHRLAAQQLSETKHVLGLQRLANDDLAIANNALQVSEEQLDVTLNSIGDAVIATDTLGVITRLNVTAARLTGWPATEAIGRPVNEVFRILSKATRLPAVVPVAETLLHGTTMGLANHTVLIGRDGQEHDIGDSCAPIRDRHSNVIGAVLVFRDVTAEYQLQQTLADTTARVQAVLTTAAEGIVTFTAHDGNIESINTAALTMFGYAQAEIVGKSFSTLIPELVDDLNSGRLDHYAATLTGETSGLGREVTGRRKDGTEFPLEIAASEVLTSGSRLFTAMLRDNTVRKRVEAERTAFDLALQAKNLELAAATRAAETANLAKSDFLSSMSHELRTPLGAILGFAQLLESGTPSPTATQSRSISQILKAGWYLLDLINEILDLAQIESGRVSLSLEPTALGKLLGECESLVEPQALSRNIKLTFPTLAPNLYARADWTRLKQVLVNLLSNAIKYNRIDGTVDVRVDVAEGQLAADGLPPMLRISITDSGLGLSPEKLKQLFQPFNRLGHDTGVIEGTGIGLVVCKRLAEQMGGKLGVLSRPDLGSTFWVEVPQADAPVAHTLANPVVSTDQLANTENVAATNLGSLAGVTGVAGVAHDTTTNRPHRYSLLYVEDNPANRMLVGDLLARRREIRLLTANDGDSGITIARAALPDVILMDINLPGTSGVQAMQILAADASTAHIRVLALSANAMPRDIERGLQAGFYRYLTKPIKVDELLAAIDDALGLATEEA